METLWHDVRYSIRKLLRSPGFTAVTLLTLALGIGANTAIFSVVHAVILRPLPFEEPEELVMVWERNLPRDRQQNVVSPANYLEWTQLQSSFTHMAAMYSTGVVLSGSGEPERVQASLVTPNFFRILRAEAALGRVLAQEEGVEGNDDVVVLSHALWQRRFGADPEVIGSRITLDDQPHTVVGVMPAGFEGIRFKPQVAAFQSDWIARQDLWVPLAFSEEARTQHGRALFVLARLKDGVDIDAAESEMVGIAARLEDRHEFNAGWSANVANLLLARAAARNREIAVRAALGAGRARIIRGFLTESLILAVLGGALGVVLAIWGVDALTAMRPADIPRLEGVGINAPVLAFTAAVAFASALFFGLVPAIQSSHPDVQESLKEGGRGSTESSGRRARRGLVVAEIGLAAVLVIGATLIVRSFWELMNVDPGFQAEKVLSAQLTLRGDKYDGMANRTQFSERLLDRVRGLPGVSEAAVTVARPLGGGLAPATSFRPVDRPAPEEGDWPVADIRMVSSGYFRTMGIVLHLGRGFERGDDADASPVVVVNETLARTYWPDGDPIGKRLIVNMGDDTPREIVGVVADVRHTSLDAAPRAMVYYPHAQLNFPWVDLVVRSAREPAALVSTLQREVRALDPDLPLHSIQPMQEVIARSLADERFNMSLLALFAALALLLATVGIYGVMSYTVSRRTHEIGIRLALGAERQVVLRDVVREGMTLAALGLAVGVIVALVATRILSGLLYEVGAQDPLTFVTIPLALALTALAACLLPALRATRVDPMVALRYE